MNVLSYMKNMMVNVPTLLLAAEIISYLNLIPILPKILKKMLVYKNTRQQSQILKGWSLK